MYFSIRTYFSEPSCGYCFSTKPVDLLEKQGFQKGTLIYFKLVHLLFLIIFVEYCFKPTVFNCILLQRDLILMIGC